MDIVNRFLSRLGYTSLADNRIKAKIEEWNSWYEGNVRDFHNYTQYNGVRMLERKRYTLGLAKKVCEDKADLLLNEKVEINISDEKTKAYIDEVLEDTGFWVGGNQLVELSNALGTGAFVEFVKNGKIIIDIIEAPSIYPLAFENGMVVECAFASSFTDNDEQYIFLNIHVLENGEYVIRNFVLNSSGEEVPLQKWFNVDPEIHTGSDLPMFQIIKPNIVNNYNRDTPFGISVFANAIDVLRSIDVAFDSMNNEFIIGKKRIFIDSSLTQVAIGESKDGGIEPVMVPTFDFNDLTFYGTNSLEDDKTLIKEINMELRIDEHIKAINNNLSLLSAKCGFGLDYYSFDKNGLKTATEVVSENSDLFRRIKKDEIILEKALTDMVRAVIYLANKFLGAAVNENAEITISFDDSIIEDKAEEQRRALLEKNSGLIDDIQYFMETRGLSEEQAVKFVKAMERRSPEHNEDIEDEY